MRPRSLKYAKVQKSSIIYARKEAKCVDLDWGTTGIKCLEGGRVRNKEMETIRKVIRKGMRKRGKIWLKFFASKGLTRKAVAVRMGKGKGNVSNWVGESKLGKVLYEIKGVSVLSSKNILLRGLERLPLKGKWVRYKV